MIDLSLDQSLLYVVPRQGGKVAVADVQGLKVIEVVREHVEANGTQLGRAEFSTVDVAANVHTPCNTHITTNTA